MEWEREREEEPNHQRWYAKRKLSWNTYTLHACFCIFGADLHAQSVLVNKISASELSRKFIKSALFVGKEVREDACDDSYFFLFFLARREGATPIWYPISPMERRRKRKKRTFVLLIDENCTFWPNCSFSPLSLSAKFELLVLQQIVKCIIFRTCALKSVTKEKGVLRSAFIQWRLLL